MKKKFLSIACEGNDGSGKNTATLTILESLLLYYPEKKIVFTNFPQYFLPVGYLIRSMNRGLGDKYVKENNLSIDSEVRLRTAIYALDRVFAWIVLENLLDEETIHVSDRLGLGQVNTWGYVLSQRKDSDPFQYLDVSLQSDGELNRFLKQKTILFSNYGVADGVKLNRETLDDYEKMEAVKLSEEGYIKSQEIYTKKGMEMYIFRTKDEKGNWRNRYDIANDVLKRVGLEIEKECEKVETLELFKRNNFTILGPREYLATLCPNNVAELDGQFEEWRNISLIPEEEQENMGVPKKQVLDEIETSLAEKIDEVLYTNSSSIAYSFSKELESAVRRLEFEHSEGNLHKFLRYLEKEKNLLGFTSSFVRKVCGYE